MLQLLWLGMFGGGKKPLFDAGVLTLAKVGGLGIINWVPIVVPTWDYQPSSDHQLQLPSPLAPQLDEDNVFCSNLRQLDDCSDSIVVSSRTGRVAPWTFTFTDAGEGGNQWRSISWKQGESVRGEKKWEDTTALLLSFAIYTPRITSCVLGFRFPTRGMITEL